MVASNSGYQPVPAGELTLYAVAQSDFGNEVEMFSTTSDLAANLVGLKRVLESRDEELMDYGTSVRRFRLEIPAGEIMVRANRVNATQSYVVMSDAVPLMTYDGKIDSQTLIDANEDDLDTIDRLFT